MGVSMTKSDLITRIAARYPYLSEDAVGRAVNATFNRISDALIQGDRVELRRFGTFSVMSRRPGTARNPRTGEYVSVGIRHVPRFRVGKSLQEGINNERVG